MQNGKRDQKSTKSAQTPLIFAKNGIDQ